jgi:Zn-dependent metalloprotease
MCIARSSRNSLHCIIPPYMVDKLETNKDDRISRMGLSNKLESAKLRFERNFIRKLPMTARETLIRGKTNVSKIKTKPTIEVYDSEHQKVKQWKRISSPATAQDISVKRAYRGAEITWKLYHQIFNRNSLDDRGMPLIQNVHYGSRYGNAFWDGSQMTYGDGDGRVFGDFTQDIDIMAHELTHGVVDFSCQLEYELQSGALNESLADVFGILARQYHLKHTAKESDWLIGQKVLKGANYAIRSLKSPGTAYKNHPILGNDPQPAIMKDFVTLPNTEEGDWGGVHINSGIPNFAFYVAAFDMGGFAWEKMGKIWYSAMVGQGLKPKAKFKDLKQATLKAARELFGSASLEEKAVINGWKEAKV